MQGGNLRNDKPARKSAAFTGMRAPGTPGNSELRQVSAHWPILHFLDDPGSRRLPTSLKIWGCTSARADLESRQPLLLVTAIGPGQAHDHHQADQTSLPFHTQVRRQAGVWGSSLWRKHVRRLEKVKSVTRVPEVVCTNKFHPTSVFLIFCLS